MTYLLDTDCVADYLVGRPDVTALLDTLSQHGAAISLITLGEIYEGIYFGRGSVKRAAAFCKRQRRAKQSDYSGLFRSPCERFVEPCFATICCVSMDDSALGSLVDCRD